MTGIILAIRPEPGCTATVETGSAMGLGIKAYPLFEIRPLAWEPPSTESIDGLLLGSANALRHGGAALARFRGKPAYSVGATTSKAAAAEGFPVGLCGEGGLQRVLDNLPGKPLRLLRIAGADHVALRPPPGVSIETRIAYESVALPMPEAVAGQLRGGGLVLLHSAAAARHFAAECDRLGVPRGRISLAALGPRIVEAAGRGWRNTRSAPVPNDAALLALALDMCHDRD